MSKFNKSRIDTLSLSAEYKIFLNFLTEKISTNSNIEKIYLFGSCSNGYATESSDIDLAVIVSDSIPVNRLFRLDIIDKIEDSIPEQNLKNIPYDIVFFSKKDFERNRRISISVASDVEREGELLYEG